MYGFAYKIENRTIKAYIFTRGRFCG